MYEEPNRLPEPFDLPSPNVMAVYGFGLLAALILGFGLYLVAKLGYVLVLYAILVGVGLGHFMALGVRWGQYPLDVKRPVILSATALYLVFNVLLYWSSIEGVSGTRPSFFGFLAYRAAQQTLAFGFNPGALVNPIVWLLEIALSSYVALRIVNKTIARLKLESVPTPVTEFVLYLLFQGHGTTEIQAELANRGWTRPVDIVRALDAAEAAVALIRTPEPSKPPEL